MKLWYIDRWMSSVQILVPFRSGKIMSTFYQSICLSVLLLCILLLPWRTCFAKLWPKEVIFHIHDRVLNLFVFSQQWSNWYGEYNENKQSNVSCLDNYRLGDKRLRFKKTENILVRNKLNYMCFRQCIIGIQKGEMFIKA